ncbi:hypothetical protein LY90DRAFT_665203 [Neocallimastix californiae]|uniref:SP-RING-type domain-containing protein n=1 Tax=Neocallimastix californiae TaxID=1754190 RepID=A0A1Y2F266_9FUNG|nr:hypothetical protein LY90DRAFT_665203 [Neocallimastix californiae]|eukprot:ORY77960.1 hypothetical protein LY90DRAFT_665203 [Neocallimastix californiae]
MKGLNLKKTSDDEIETTSSIVSLRCPISKARIKIPCRFKECTHVQCFDVYSYLQLNEQSPNWKCPVCNTRYDWKSLVIDGYMQDIIDNVSSDVNSVTVEVNGTWHIEEIQSPLNNENHYESEEDEEEDRFLAKLEAEIKEENNSVIDLTLSDDENKSTKSTDSVPFSISSSLTTSLQTEKANLQPSSSSEQLNSHSNRKRTLADLIAPQRKKVSGKSARLIFENTKSSSRSNNVNKISTSEGQRSSRLTSSYFNSDMNINDNSDQSSLNFHGNLLNTTTNTVDFSSLLSISPPLSTNINYSLSKNTSELTTLMNIDSTSSLNNIINLDESDSSNNLSSVKNKNNNTLASKSLNISANTNTVLNSSKFPYSSMNTLESKLPDLSTLSSLNPSSLNSSNSSVVNVTANSSINNESSGSLDIFSSNQMSRSLGINQNSLTIPTSLPSTKTKSSSITIPMSTGPTLSSSSLKTNNLNSFIDVEDNPYTSLLKSVLLNQSSKVSTSAPSSPSLNESSLKLKPHSITHSPHSSPKPTSISLSAQSSPGLGRIPTKFKNISPKPPKVEPTTSLNFNNYYNNLLSSLNYSYSLATTTPSSINISNPSLTMANNSLPLNNTTDPTTLFYLNTLANNSLLNSNVSQLAAPPPVPNYFDSSLMTSFQSNPYTSLLYGNNYALSMASSMNAATEKLLKEAAANTNLTTNSNALNTTERKTTSMTSSAISSLASNSINPNLNSPLSNTSLLQSTSLPVNTSTTTLLNSLNSSSTTSTSDTSTPALLNSLNVGATTTTTSATPSNNISDATQLNSLNPNLLSTLKSNLLTPINKLSSSTLSSSVSASSATPLTSLSSFETNTANLASLGTYQGLAMNPLVGLNYTNSELYNLALTNNSLATTPTNPLLNLLVSNSSLASNTNSILSNNSNESKK